jgi:chorismate mutase / prephenate dehydratase
MSLDLGALRQRIDAIDEELLALISERARLAESVAVAKRAVEENPEFYRPEREAQILTRLIGENPGPLSDADIRRLFQEIISACRACEHETRVAYLGPAGTYTHAAAITHFGSTIETVSHNSIAGVFRAVEQEQCAFGVAPVENSSEGGVTHTLDEFLRSSLQIVGELEVPIHHHLLSHALEAQTISTVFAHQQALAQCRRWLEQYLPGVRQVPVSSNAEAAKRVSEEQDTSQAAIAGETAATVYDLPILANCIEDETSNTTRFLVIGKKSPPPSGRDKTSMILLADNKPGALYHLLEPFAKNNVSMCRIESRPSRKTNWEYVFFIDVLGHQHDPALKAAMETLDAERYIIKVIGSYPAAVKV